MQPLDWRSVDAAGGTDRFLWGAVNFRGPATLDDLKTHTYPTYSFFDLEYSEEQIQAGVKPKIDPAVFRGKAVFVGATGAGLHDVFQTPFANGEMPGIQVHAAVADDILSNRFLRAGVHWRPDSRPSSRPPWHRRGGDAAAGVVGHRRLRSPRSRPSGRWRRAPSPAATG